MSYRAKEVKEIIKASHAMRHTKIRVYQITGAARFFWFDNRIEAEEKLWHPLIILRYLLIAIVTLPIEYLTGTPIICFEFFRSKNHPTAVKLTSKKEIEEAIEKDKNFHKKELDQHSWV